MKSCFKMFGSVGFFDSEDSDEEIINLKVMRRNLREKNNPLNLASIEFQKRYRLNKDAFIYVLEQINLKEGKRFTYIPPMLRLAASLQVLGSGSYQWSSSNDFITAMGQSTLSLCLEEVTNELQACLCPLWIKRMNEEETKEWFYERYKIPGVVGCIDGTHVYILRPKENEEIFVNRKCKHSINVMIICDHKHRITNICSQFPGSAHDSFVWDQSSAKREFEARRESGQGNSWLLGDSGYGIEPWLITPYRSAPPNTDESYFNDVFAKARANVEMCIGEYKGRWRILMEERKANILQKKLRNLQKFCAALHNICIHYNIPFNPINLAPHDDPALNVENEESSSNDLKKQAIQTRDKIKRSLINRVR